MASVTVSFSYKTTLGTAATGEVRFRLPGASTTPVALVNGTGSIVVHVAGASATYVVSERIDHVAHQTYEVTINATPATVNLAALRSAI